MHNWSDSDLIELARLYLDNEQSFVVRRCVQRFEAGEITAREAVRRATSPVLVVDAPDGQRDPTPGAVPAARPMPATTGHRPDGRRRR